MSASLPASHISFDLWSSCPFEQVQVLGPELGVNVGASSLTTPAPAGPVLAPPVLGSPEYPFFDGVCLRDYSRHPDEVDIRSDYSLDQYDDFAGSLDATAKIPRGSVHAGQVHHASFGSFFMAHAHCWRQ